MSGSLLSENAPGKQVVEDFFPSYAKILIAGNAFLYFCNIFRLPSQMHFYFLFSNAVTQFLEVIKPILSRTCFLAYAPELSYSRKNPNTGCWGHTFLKKIPRIFRFLTLPLEIPGKMKLYPWKFHQIVSHPLEFPRPKTKTHGYSTLFFSWSCPEIPLLFLLTPGVPRFYFFNPHGNSMSSTPHPPPPLFVFFWNSPWSSNSFINTNL